MTKDTVMLARVLSRLCPMHVILDAEGRIIHAGPTMRKMRAGLPLVGAVFSDVFAVKRPRGLQTHADLQSSAGIKLHLQFCTQPCTEFKGVATPGPTVGTLVVNLSFGISVVAGVQDYNLTDADFAPTDLTTEMLYLIEAKSTAMASWRSISLRLQGAKREAEEQAFTDTLTGLKNRRAFEQILRRHVQAQKGFALMLVDLDYFKRVNDTQGHVAGDHVLREVAQIMAEEVRSHDSVARVGGDEFMILVPGAKDRKGLAAMGERLISRIEEAIPYGGQNCEISCSIGTAFFEPGGEADAGRLIEDVDLALYASKTAGRRRHTFFDQSLRAHDNRQLKDRRTV